jgi:hypothetical protein
MSLHEIAKRDAAMITLQDQLLDHSGHVRPELSTGERRELVREINKIRAANNFKPLDMRGR